MSNGEESHVMTFQMLPDDVVLNCLSRIPRLHYPSLSLVSKKFRSIIASRELYETRSFLGRTESCLYVSLRFGLGSNPLIWFTLCQKPNSSSKILVPISSPNSPFERMSGVVAVDSSIYSIGGVTNPSSRVMVMDSYSLTYRDDAPSMRVARVLPSVCVLDGKIYVTGGCKNADSTNWIEVFDTKTQSWEFLQIPSEEICIGSEYKTMGYEGTIYVGSHERNVTYKVHKGKWRAADLKMHWGWCGKPICVIDNVLFHYYCWMIYWYDSKNRIWIPLKGLSSSFMFPFNMESDISAVRLTDYGGNMSVLWVVYKTINYHTEKIMYCAEIAIERDQGGEIWGTLKWSDIVFETNQHYWLEDVLATTV
ncbi:hypothetical protein EUTSA_v10012107mg [Eutrema salsugineum]|uniref:F-box domain-containing protein n=1 Tax=Eutrema salsugineum TaxID=72664 RepID=V4KSL4_EUTSA|nr:F-box/kelch-repeat protein At4g23580 [Eutrema salsugineum]ESQ30368.1 hypothetical protein EUTSA_v10012107mg [Eutrema salsugineum]